MQLLSDASTESPAGERCATQLIETIPLVMQFMRRQMRKSSKRELSVAQLRTLYFISINDHPSLSCAADFIGLSLPAMSRLVDGLVKKGLVLRRACAEDRRHVRLVVTPAGQTAIDTAWKGTHARLSQEMLGLSDEQRIAIGQTMDILRTTFDPETLKD